MTICSNPVGRVRMFPLPFGGAKTSATSVGIRKQNGYQPYDLTASKAEFSYSALYSQYQRPIQLKNIATTPDVDMNTWAIVGP